jgi:hypothetical protein
VFVDVTAEITDCTGFAQCTAAAGSGPAQYTSSI